MASRRSRMRRISSSPVLTCSGFSRRTHEARSVHCSRVSTGDHSTSQTRHTRTSPEPRWGHGSYRAGSAERWCEGPEPRSAAPSLPSSPFLGCSSCRCRSRPTPAGREQGPVIQQRPGSEGEEDEGTLRAWVRILQASMTKVRDFICSASLMDDTLFSRLMAKSCRRHHS